MNAEFFTNNRKNFMDKIENDSMVLLYSGQTPVKSNDQEMHPFPVNRNFFYLTGIQEEGVWLVMLKANDKVVQQLFIAQPDEFIIKWTGKMLTKEEAAKTSGLKEEEVRYAQDFDRLVGGRLHYVDRVYFSFDRLDMFAASTRAEELASQIRCKYPSVEIKNCGKTLSSLRAIKTPEELDCIRKAGDTTIDSLRFMLTHAKPGEFEYQWAADFEYNVARSGMRLGFTTIAAAGPNATMLHYSDNNCVANAGDLLLVDLGAEYNFYSSDVSRTFPIGGKFSDRQKELFNIVKEAMAVAKEKMRPGVGVREPNKAVIEFYKKALKSAKLITEDSEVSKYYYHGVSHSLGLDTHDPMAQTEYAPGMVVTCEPGLYVAEEGIGIRLENDILITDGDPEDLIGDRLMSVDEIENLMA